MLSTFMSTTTGRLIPFLFLFSVVAIAPAAQRPAFSWRQTDSSLALLNADHVVWQFNYGKELEKVHFHPLSLLDGTVLTALGPRDHRWHHALWFSWKELNHINYWDRAGDPKLTGRTKVLTARVVPNPDHSAHIEMTLSYHPDGGVPVLRETRTIFVHRPAKNGSYRIDWRGTFTAGDQPVFLKGGISEGGYAGLSVRIAQSTGEWRLVDSEGREDSPGGRSAKNTHGQRARWMDFSMADKATGHTGGIAILEYPSSFRHPSQWHNIINDKVPFGYFSPATLWSEPYTLPAGKTLMVYYRVLVHPGRADKPAIEREWKQFSRR
jgi:hypothetical protein